MFKENYTVPSVWKSDRKKNKSKNQYLFFLRKSENSMCERKKTTGTDLKKSFTGRKRAKKLFHVWNWVNYLKKKKEK